MTAASQALQCYRHRFMDMKPVLRQWIDGDGKQQEKIEMIGVIEPHDKEVVKRLERASYQQGYSWVYRVGRVFHWSRYYTAQDMADKRLPKHISMGPVYILDVNSMYPAVMRDCNFPCRLLGHSICDDITGLYRTMNKYSCVANVLIETHTRPYPVKFKDHTNYHIGKFWTTLAWPELCIAREEACIRKVSMFAWYETRDLFSRYVDYFYPLKCEYRKAGNRMMENLCKLMLNALPGKFGQHGGNWISLPGIQPMVRWQQYSQYWPETKRIESFRGLGDLLQIKGRDQDSDHTFTAIPAFVNSYARLRLWEYIQICGSQNVFYCNVDSIHCNEEGYNRLLAHGCVDEYALGKLRLEKTAEYAEYRDVRNYTLDGQHCISGIPSKAKETDSLTFVVPQFERLNTILDREPDSSVSIVEETKEVKTEFKLGAIDSEGRTFHRRLSGMETAPLQGIADKPEDMEA